MKKSMVNQSEIAGYLYDHKLEKKVTGPTSKVPGTEYIRGSIQITTDDECLNIVKVDFVYIAKTYTDKSGKTQTNNTFNFLDKVINGEIFTVVGAGKDKAQPISCNGNLALLEYPSRQNPDELVSILQNQARFVNQLNRVNDYKADFRTDILITNVAVKEADPDKGIDEYASIKGCIFDWAKNPLPVTYKAINPAAIAYFENLTLPCFTQVHGVQKSSVVKVKHVEESAFGDPEVTYTTRSTRDFVVTGARPEPYGIDAEDTGNNLTLDEIKELSAKRERNIAAIKQNYAEWQSKAKTATPASNGATPEFVF